MATATRRPSAPAERLIAEVLRAQGAFFDAARRPSEEFLRTAIDLPATFDPLDAETIREAQLAYQAQFQERSAERLRLGVRKAMAQPTRQSLIRALRAQQRQAEDLEVKANLEAQIERVRRQPDPRRRAVVGLLEQERRLAQAHAAAMAGRARAASRSVQVQAESPSGAFWRRDPESDSCDECRFMDGKLWPWEVLERVSPPRHPNCVTGDVVLSAPSGVARAYARRYSGEIVRLRFQGHDLTITPNHPVLTPQGWIAAGLLREGDQVIGSDRRERRVVGDPHDHDAPAFACEMFDALREASPVPSVRVPLAAEHFHGDGGDGEVDVVGADGLLWNDGFASFHEQVEQGRLCARHAREALAAPGYAVSMLGGLTLATNGSMGSSDATLASLGRGGGGGEALLLGGAALLDSGVGESQIDGVASDAEAVGDALDRLSGEVALHDLLAVERHSFTGHVYNLETSGGWYMANGIVTHNCRCVLVPVAAARRNGWISARARVPTAKQGIHRARRMLRESISGAILVEAVDRGLLREEWTLSPEALAAKARAQSRDRLGRWRDTGLTPGVGRRAPGWMRRDVDEIRGMVTEVSQYGPWRSTQDLRRIGEKIDKVATRYSTARHLNEEADRANATVGDLFDIGYKRWKDAGQPATRDPQDFLTDAEDSAYSAAEQEMMEKRRQALDESGPRAYLSLLRQIRPMGGELRTNPNLTIQAQDFAHEEIGELDDRLEAALAEVSHVLPTAWIEDLNGKGETRFNLSTSRAWHKAETSDSQAQQVDRLLARRGGEFVGYADGLPVVRTNDAAGERLLSVGETGTVVPVGPGQVKPGRWLTTEQHTWVQRHLASGHYEFVGYEKGNPVLRDLTAEPPLIPDLNVVLPSGGLLRAYGEAPDYVLVGRDLEPGEYVAPPAPENSTININPSEHGTLLHELGHRIERYYGEERANGYRPMMEALVSFLSERRGTEQIRPLNEIVGREQYDPWEKGFKDEFADSYIGKSYADATEVLSMGLQMLFYPDWRRRLDKDDDMRHFLLGLLAAS